MRYHMDGRKDTTCPFDIVPSLKETLVLG